MGKNTAIHITTETRDRFKRYQVAEAARQERQIKQDEALTALLDAVGQK